MHFFLSLMFIIRAVLTSFSVACILLPNDAIDYGTAGIAVINSSGVIAGKNKTLLVLSVATDK